MRVFRLHVHPRLSRLAFREHARERRDQIGSKLRSRSVAKIGGRDDCRVVRVTDPSAYAASLLVIVAACLLAAWIPATRAARLDPMRTLRQE